MNRLSEFLKELRDRLSNPLFSSFILSWCVLNWEIMLGLLFYDISELQIDGYNSYNDLIKRNLNLENALYYPMYCALFYTFIFPFIKNVILAFNAWTKSWGDSWNLRVSKGGKIPTLKYLKLLEESNKNNELLEFTIENESIYRNEKVEVENKLFKLEEEFAITKSMLEKWELSNAVSVIDGKWEYHITTSLTKEKVVHKISIQSGRISFYNTANHLQDESIKYFHLDPRLNRIFMVVESYISNGSGGTMRAPFRFQTLEMLDENKLLRGKEDDVLEIEYKKTN